MYVKLQRTTVICTVVIAVFKKKKTKQNNNNNNKQPVGNSESEGILSDNCAIHVGYCVTVAVERRLRLVTGDRWSGVSGHRKAGVPFPSDPPPSLSPSKRISGEEARVCEMTKLYTPLENQENMF